VSQAATQGDELANEGTGWALGWAFNVTMNPQRFVLGGGVTKAGARFWEVVLRETALPEVNFIVPAALGDALWGAVALANDLAFDRR